MEVIFKFILLNFSIFCILFISENVYKEHRGLLCYLSAKKGEIRTLENARELFFINKEDMEMNAEVTANRYILKCMHVTLGMLTVVWVLNILNIFTINRQVMTLTYLIALIIYVTGIVACKVFGIAKSWMKYYLITWVSLTLTVITTLLTFHAVLGCMIPIIYASMYSSKKLAAYTYFLTVVSIAVSVYVGYYFGICDANMVLLTGEPLAKYITEDKTFALNYINDNPVWTLSLFFVLPRCMICAVISKVSGSVSDIIQSNMKNASRMKTLAEIDGMTGVYNRSKYLDVISNSYREENSIAVIFWDINNLKTVNDNMGHEHGDRMIVTMAESLKKIASDNAKAYRVGGDEFVMIMSGSDENDVKRKIKEWRTELDVLNEKAEEPISVSVGYACGKGKYIEDIINEADRMMYKDKEQYHNSRNSK